MPDENSQQPNNNIPVTLVINYDAATNGMAWGMTGPMPLPLLVFTLEKIKMQLMADNAAKELAEHQRKQQQGSLIIPQGGKLPGLKL